MIIKTHGSYVNTGKYESFSIGLDNENDVVLCLVNENNGDDDEYMILPYDEYFNGYDESYELTKLKYEICDSLERIISNCLSNEKTFCDLYQTFLSDRDK